MCLELIVLFETHTVNFEKSQIFDKKRSSIVVNIVNLNDTTLPFMKTHCGGKNGFH